MGKIKERRQFDAWGNIKIYYKNEVLSPLPSGGDGGGLLTDRGYTAHEHFFSVGIIHINARLYDPVLHTFLSPDANITDPSNPQNYNRYAYALNNPLMYVDYSGNDPVTVAIATATIIGAFIGGVTYVGLSLYNGTAITWGGLAKNIIIGAISGAASGGIGQIMNSANAAMCIATQTLSQMQINIILAIPAALMHGISQGIIQGVSGGNAEQSFVTAAISSIAGSGFGMTGSLGSSPVGQSLFGAVMGGSVSNMQGGNFWEGAAIGLTVGLLNHAGKKLYSVIDGLLKKSLTPQQRQSIGENYPTYDKYPNAESVYKEVGGDLYKEYLKDPENYINTCAIRLSLAFEKAGINIGGDYNGIKGLKYYTAATRIYEAINSRFNSFNQGFNMSQYGIVIQFFSKSYTGQVFHVDVVYIKNNQGRFGHTLYGERYNKFY